MLFLVRVEVANVPAGDVARLVQLIEQEWEVVMGLVAGGQIKACGKLAGLRGAVAIFDVESAAALDEVVARLPLAPYFSRLEIEPLEPPEGALATARRRAAMYRRLEARRVHIGDGSNGGPPRPGAAGPD